MHPQYTRVCPTCTNPFAPKQKAQRYCSPRCAYHRRSANPAEALRLKVVVDNSPDGCHLYTGTRSRGYGHISISGQIHLAHRLAWELANGPIPPGHYVCHKCDNPLCVRVDHLFLGTPADNIADMVAKGRQARGAAHGSHTRPEAFARGERVAGAAVDAAQVREIRRLHAEENLTYTELAARFPISKGGIGHIVRGETWRHVS